MRHNFAKKRIAVTSRPALPEEGSAGSSMIQLENVFKYYRSNGHVKIVLDHISMDFMAGRSYGILGVNGAGKSTMMRLLAGTELPTAAGCAVPPEYLGAGIFRRTASKAHRQRECRVRGAHIRP